MSRLLSLKLCLLPNGRRNAPAEPTRLCAPIEAGGDSSSSAERFERAVALCLRARLSAKTLGPVTRDDLARMKPTAFLVYTGRAELIEEGVLVDALRAGRAGFAAIEVDEREPALGGSHPLLAMPNERCTHHIALAEHETFERYFAEGVEDLLAFADGTSRNVVNPDLLRR